MKILIRTFSVLHKKVLVFVWVNEQIHEDVWFILSVMNEASSFVSSPSLRYFHSCVFFFYCLLLWCVTSPAPQDSLAPDQLMEVTSAVVSGCFGFIFVQLEEVEMCRPSLCDDAELEASVRFHFLLFFIFCHVSGPSDSESTVGLQTDVQVN